MNDLNPDLKRLLRLARKAPIEPQPMPHGFASRIVARWEPATNESEWMVWQRAVWGSAWAAVALILLGLALFVDDNLQRVSFYEVTPAYQVVSTEFVP